MPDMQTILDEREIARALSRVARIFDTKSWDDLGDVFAHDLTFDYGTGENAGIDALRTTLTRFLDRCGPTQHLLGSILVDVDGDAAVSRAYVQARHQGVAEPLGPVFDSHGEYVDRWERQPEGWRIVRRDAIWAMHRGQPAVLAIGKGDFGIGSATTLPVRLASGASRLFRKLRPR